MFDNMLTLINDLARVHLKDYHGVSQDGCSSVEFHRAPQSSQVCITNFNFYFTNGFIKYKLNGQSHTSQRRIMLQCADLKQQIYDHSLPSSTEIAFFKVMVPQMQQLTGRPMDHLFPGAYACRVGLTESSEKLVTIFEFPEGSVVVGNALLDFSQLQLMARKIGEFHAYSFKMRSLKPGFGQDRHFVRPTYAGSDRVGAELQRCLQLWFQDPQYPQLLSQDGFKFGVDHLQEMVKYFFIRLPRGFNQQMAADCWVLSHQNYSQTSVVFDGQEAQQDMRIFNWHSVGFASLAVDLVIMLFVEAAPETRSRAVFDQLVAIYREALASTFTDIQVPSADDILAQIKVCIPVALFVLGNRVLLAKVRSEREEALPESIWKEDLVVKVFEYLITGGFI